MNFLRFPAWVLVGLLVAPLAGPSMPEALGDKFLQFDAGPRSRPGKPWQPKGWTVQGEAKGCTSVELGGEAKFGVRLELRTMLETLIPVPEPPREEGEAGSRILIGVLVFGRGGEEDAGAASLEVSTFLEDREDVLTKAAFSTSAEISRERPERLWLTLNPALSSSLKGAKVRLRLAPADAHGVVLDHVEVVRIPVNPSWKHLGRSNGGLGPDRLGAGALGFDALTEHRQSPLAVVAVRKGTPADRAGLLSGDILVSVNGRPLPECDLSPGHAWFERSHEAVLGRAVESALSSEASDPMHRKVDLRILRAGEASALTLHLGDRPPLEEDFPFGERGDAAFVKDLQSFVLGSQDEDGSFGNNVVRTGLGVLALLGTKDRSLLPRAARGLKWLLDRKQGPEDQGLAYWSIGYTGIALAEYALATGDSSVLRWGKRAQRLLIAGEHTSAFGMTSLGHGPDGLPYENKALVAPLSHLLVFEALMGRAGVTPLVWPRFQAFVDAAWSDPASGGHGAMGYNASHRDQAEFWSRTGLCLAAAHVRGDREEMRKAMIKIMRERHAWMLNSHAYGEPGAALGLLALAGADRAAFREILRAWRWKFEGAYESGYGLRYSTPHMGSPYMGEDELVNVAYLAVLSVRQNGLVLTGGDGEPWASNVLPPLLDGPVERRDPDEKRKSTWKVMSASGGLTPEEARERAARAIDGDQVLAWRTDAGKGAASYPHHLTLDLAQPLTFSTLTFRFASSDLSPSMIKIETSEDGETFTPFFEPRDLGSWSPILDLELDATLKTRYVRLEFQSPRSQDSRGLAIRELDFVMP